MTCIRGLEQKTNNKDCRKRKQRLCHVSRIKNRDGRVLMWDEAILNRWMEFFPNTLMRHASKPDLREDTGWRETIIFIIELG